jgi:hypothetical protein
VLPRPFRGGDCTNDTGPPPPPPPQGTTWAGETRKLIRPVVKILRNNRILMCEDHPKGVCIKRPPRRRCSQEASLGARVDSNADNPVGEGPRNPPRGEPSTAILSLFISCRVLRDDKGGPRLCLWEPMTSDTTGKWSGILYLFLLRCRPRRQVSATNPHFHVCADSRTLQHLRKKAAVFIWQFRRASELALSKR